MTRTISTTNPTTGQSIAKYNLMSAPEALKLVDHAGKAFARWSRLEFSHRADLVRQLATILRQKKRVFAELMATEMGKPIVQGGAEIEKCAWVCEYLADFGAEFLQDEIVTTEAKKSYVAYEALGVIFGVMPWNFPFWQVFRFAVPALLAGNTVIFKHAPNTTGCGLAIAEAFKEAGFEDGVCTQVIIDLDLIETIVAHKNVGGVSLTGSVAAGKSIAALAGKHLKKCVLELGGSDPYLVLHDADLELASETCVTARMHNAGQTCVAAKRLIVDARVIEKFTALAKQKLDRFVMGDPLDVKTTLGPLVREDLREVLHRQVTESVKAGAQCLRGGLMCTGPGFFYPATLLTQVKKGMPAFDEELFGPVAVIVAARDEAHAIELANDSDFGLGAAVFTKDLERGEKIAREIFAGNCFVNAMVKSDPRLPFGGVKNSGLGRELGAHGMREFCNVKTVWVG